MTIPHFACWPARCQRTPKLSGFQGFVAARLTNPSAHQGEFPVVGNQQQVSCSLAAQTPEPPWPEGCGETLVIC